MIRSSKIISVEAHTPRVFGQIVTGGQAEDWLGHLIIVGGKQGLRIRLNSILCVSSRKIPLQPNVITLNPATALSLYTSKESIPFTMFQTCLVVNQQL